MPWPDLFFKSRKPKPLPEIITVPPKAAEPSRDETEKIEAAKAEVARKEKEKVESLRALSESGVIRLPAKPKESPAPTAASVATPAAPAAPEAKAEDADKANAKTALLPVATPRPGSISLRQVAKLTDDARLPKKEEEPHPAASASESKPVEPSVESSATANGPAAIVPPAFSVPAEAGTILEKPAERAAVPASSKPTEPAKPIEVAPVIEKPQVETPKSEPAADRNTARVHLEHATTGEPTPASAAPTSSTSAAIEPVKAADARAKQEFILSNGERILGHVLSETPQTIYLDHGTLGVLTLPRSQIATKPIEVILINGDRIVGDLIAETPECLYIKHASLGMVTVPHGQRSTRVVEAILKDGDRILGEVLAETDNFTVIRSATLGTVAVQHEQVAMLNRKIEQMQLRALPNAAPALPDKKD